MATRSDKARLTAIGCPAVWHGDAAYEAARAGTVWRANKPERYPDVIVCARDAADVIAAVKYAAAHGLKIGTCSGGHSWTSPFLRDGAMLIDVSRLNTVDIDARTRTVRAGPGTLGGRLNQALASYGLIFPGGHHPGVALGGFLLCGGFGWNSRQWGAGCEHIRSVDVVTANGELIHADETHHTDLLWAARGAGAGFFGIVTRFELAVHALPAAIKQSSYLYPATVVDDLLSWARQISADVAPFVELVISSATQAPGAPPGEMSLTLDALAMSENDAEADRALALFESCPVKPLARQASPRGRVTLEDLYQKAVTLTPDGLRYACDNCYVNAGPAELLPAARALFTAAPSPRSYAFWSNWGPVHALPDMALSVQGDIYIAAYAIWDEARDDARMQAWPVEQISRLQNLSVGAEMNDENMIGRAERYLSEQASQRLAILRKRYDPDARFLSFLK